MGRYFFLAFFLVFAPHAGSGTSSSERRQSSSSTLLDHPGRRGALPCRTPCFMAPMIACSSALEFDELASDRPRDARARLHAHALLH